MTVGLVFDTNVYITALKRGTYSEYWLRQSSMTPSIAVYSSEEILLEVQAKLEEKLGLARAQAVEYVSGLREATVVVAPRAKVEVIAADPDDNKIIECALEAKARLVITGDHHLLDLKDFKGISFVHPRMMQYLFTES
jgi:putative PIN family toxin of toxin-antitoxin system